MRIALCAPAPIAAFFWHAACSRAALAAPAQVVYGHLDDPEGQDIKRGASYLRLRPGERRGRSLFERSAPAAPAAPQRWHLP